jgi:hypothetical protein
MRHAAFAALILVLFPLSALADVVGVSGAWTSPPFDNSLQSFTFSGLNFGGFTSNEFGFRPNNNGITPGSSVGFSGTLFAGDFGGITINGHSYSMSQFDCSLNIGHVPCATGSVTINGVAPVPDITHPFAENITLVFPVVVNGSYFGCSLDHTVCDSVSFHGEGLATMPLFAALNTWTPGTFTATISAVPEPSTWLLLVSGLIVLAQYRTEERDATTSLPLG